MAYITGTTQEERQYGSKKKVTFTATSGQTVFTPGFDYIPGSNVLEVYINGVKQAGSAYTESQNFITLTEGVQAGDVVEIVSDVVEHRLTGEVEWLRRNYGPYPSDPTLRPDGTAMVAGDEYFNSTLGKKKYFNGSIWVTYDGFNVFTSTFDGAYPLALGNYRFWVDGAGNLRVKDGVPTSDTDGVKVGQQ